MKIEISLEDIFADDYGETVASLIRGEINDIIRREVRKAVGGAVQEHIRSVQAEISRQVKKATPQRIAALLRALEGDG